MFLKILYFSGAFCQGQSFKKMLFQSKKTPPPTPPEKEKKRKKRVLMFCWWWWWWWVVVVIRITTQQGWIRYLFRRKRYVCVCVCELFVFVCVSGKRVKMDYIAYTLVVGCCCVGVLIFRLQEEGGRSKKVKIKSLLLPQSFFV